MISWHRIGQKVACIGDGWTSHITGRTMRGPRDGEICTIAELDLHNGILYFGLEEYDNWLAASRFRPVYPEIIDQLRNLDAPVPSDEDMGEGEGERERVGEGEHV